MSIDRRLGPRLHGKITNPVPHTALLFSFRHRHLLDRELFIASIDDGVTCLVGAELLIHLDVFDVILDRGVTVVDLEMGKLLTLS